MNIPKPEHPDKRLGQIWHDMSSVKKGLVRTLLCHHKNRTRPNTEDVQTLIDIRNTLTPDEQILMYYAIGEPSFTEENLDLWEVLYE